MINGFNPYDNAIVWRNIFVYPISILPHFGQRSVMPANLYAGFSNESLSTWSWDWNSFPQSLHLTIIVIPEYNDRPYYIILDTHRISPNKRNYDLDKQESMAKCWNVKYTKHKPCGKQKDLYLTYIFRGVPRY